MKGVKGNDRISNRKRFAGLMDKGSGIDRKNKKSYKADSRITAENKGENEMITKTDCYVHTLETLLSQVNHLTDLDLIENLIDNYTDILKVDLIKYRHQVRQMRENFPKRVFYLEVRE